MCLWELLSNVVLQPEVEDTHIRKFSAYIACTPPNQPMRPCLLEPLISILGEKKFGKAGPQGNASSSCGQWVTIDAGQLTD